jgi:hypothetical protein
MLHEPFPQGGLTERPEQPLEVGGVAVLEQARKKPRKRSFAARLPEIGEEAPRLRGQGHSG